MIYLFRNKNYMGGFTMKNVQSLSKEELVLVAGGYTAKQCLQAIGSWGIAGTGAGAAGGPAGAFVGAHVGVIAESAVCIGGFLGQ